MHLHNSLPNGKTEMSMLKANQVSVFQKHYSADAVAICVLLLQYAVSAITCVSKVQFLSPKKFGVAQLVEQQSIRGFESHSIKHG
jgi:hypothetical protein